MSELARGRRERMTTMGIVCLIFTNLAKTLSTRGGMALKWKAIGLDPTIQVADVQIDHKFP